MLAELLFPLVCPGCGGHGSPICDSCRGRLLPAPSAPPPPGVDAWCAPFAYAGVARELVARAKYRNARAVVPWLAQRMVEEVVASAPRRVEVVTWAPTTPARRHRRGFDPAEVLARAVARASRLPARALLTRRPGPPQTGLDASARRLGPGFHAVRKAPDAVVLVDDVATTGATLAAAARALRAAGAREIVAVTAARTPAPR